MDDHAPSQRSIDLTTREDDWGDAPVVSDSPVIVPKTDGLANRRRRQVTWALILAAIALSSVMLIYAVWPRGERRGLASASREEAIANMLSEKEPSSTTVDPKATLTQQTSLLEQAKTCWATEDFECVVRICTSILDADPDNERALLVRSSAFSKLGDSSKAVADHLELKRIESDLWRKPSPDIAKALVEVAKDGMIEGFKAMDRGDLMEAKTRFDQSCQLLQSASVVSPSSVSSTLLTERAILWSQRCALAKGDASGQLAIGLKTRAWKDSTGSHSFVARLVKVDTKVRLEGVDGRQVIVDLNKLSPNDQKWIENQNRLASAISEQSLLIGD